MAEKTLRVVHYINQFFGGLGAEEAADTGIEVREEPVGLGKALQSDFGGKAEVVATVICGDNHIAENLEKVTDEIVEIISKYNPDAVVAGPAFYAGRYGVACGSICQAVEEKLEIPAVTAMYVENPGVDLYHRKVFIVKTDTTPKGMNQVVSTMAQIVMDLVEGKEIGKPEEVGYFPRGTLINELAEKNAAQRGVEMLQAKLRGEPYETEVPLPKYDRVDKAPAIEDLKNAKLALVTDGGLVAKGNPDGLVPTQTSQWGGYELDVTFKPGEYEIVHGGYDHGPCLSNPNRLVPLDVVSELQEEGAFAQLHSKFYSTCGCGSVLEYVKNIGRKVAEELKADGVQGAILTST